MLSPEFKEKYKRIVFLKLIYTINLYSIDIKTVTKILKTDKHSINKWLQDQQLDFSFGDNRPEPEALMKFFKIIRLLNFLIPNKAKQKQWLTQRNESLNGIPIQIMTKEGGLERVAKLLLEIKQKD